MPLDILVAHVQSPRNYGGDDLEAMLWWRDIGYGVGVGIELQTQAGFSTMTNSRDRTESAFCFTQILFTLLALCVESCGEGRRVPQWTE